MCDVQLNLLVLGAADIDRAAQFYQALWSLPGIDTAQGRSITLRK